MWRGCCSLSELSRVQSETTPKILHMNYRSVTVTSIAFLSFSTFLLGDTLLSFGGDYGSSSTNARTASGSGSGPYYETVAFDDTTVMSPSTDYTGPVYYGGFEFSSSSINGSVNRQGVRDYASGDTIYFQTYSATGWLGSDLSMHVAVLFKQEDWLNGHQSGSNNITGLSMTTNAFSAGDGRFLVEIGGAYYVSNSTVSVSGTKTLILDSVALASETWALYSPNSDLNFDQTATFSALSLNDVTAVGFYVERDSWTGGSNTTDFGMGIQTFTVTGNTIPESSSFAGITGFACLLVCFCLRRSC